MAYLDKILADRIVNAPNLAGVPPPVVREVLALAWEQLASLINDTVEQHDVIDDIWDSCESCHCAIRMGVTGKWVSGDDEGLIPMCTQCSFTLQLDQIEA